ncbi:hypothetical protein ABT112_11845 [Streptomyces sp. NPDC002055]|uniref:hypothetical protein n=1 Tax=Streptomyces sp. NPDC002055 TaxID=3154534 RepID=UPI0033264D12
MNTWDAAGDVVGATDVELTALGNSRFQIIAGARKFVVEAKGESGETLRHLLTEVVPKLNRTAPVREQLTAAEAERLRPHMKNLAAMGVLLQPRESIGSKAELRLYSFISRRTSSPDAVFASVRRDITLTGPSRVTDVLGEALRRQGLRVRDAADAPDSEDSEAGAAGAAGAARASGAAGADDRTGNTTPDGLTVVVSLADEAALHRAAHQLCAEHRPFLPVLVTPEQIRLGPWTMPGESACPRCSAPYGASLGDTGVGTVADGLAGDGATADDTPRRTTTPAVAHDSWPSLQPGCLVWAAGLTAQLTLRAFMPMGAEHPWGRIVTLDPVTCEQTSVRAWRDPYCACCATAGPVAQEWLEF